MSDPGLRELLEAVREDDYPLCSQCDDTGWLRCLHCHDGAAEPFCGDDLCFGGGCITGACAPETCRWCAGAGEFECKCEGARALLPDTGEAT